MINIELPTAQTNMNVQIVDLAGKTHFNQHLNSSKNIQVDLNQGVYFVKIVAENSTYTKKIMVY